MVPPGVSEIPLTRSAGAPPASQVSVSAADEPLIMNETAAPATALPSQPFSGITITHSPLASAVTVSHVVPPMTALIESPEVATP